MSKRITGPVDTYDEITRGCIDVRLYACFRMTQDDDPMGLSYLLEASEEELDEDQRYADADLSMIVLEA